MSYIQIEIGGKMRGLKFSQGTNIILNKKVTELDEIDTGLREAFGFQTIIWAALLANCVIKGERFTKSVDNEGKVIEVAATFEDVCEWCEKIPVAIVVEVINLFSEVNAFKDDLPVPTEEEKKNQPETTNMNVIELPVAD